MQSTILPPFSCPIFFPLFEFRSCHFFFFVFSPPYFFFLLCTHLFPQTARYAMAASVCCRRAVVCRSVISLGTLQMQPEFRAELLWLCCKRKRRQINNRERRRGPVCVCASLCNGLLFEMRHALLYTLTSSRGVLLSASGRDMHTQVICRAKEQRRSWAHPWDVIGF